MLHVRLKPSYRLAALLTAAHAAAYALLWSIDVYIAAQLAVSALIAASLVVNLRGAALLAARDAIVGLELADDGTLNFETRDGTWHAGRLAPTSFVAPWLTVLNVVPATSRRMRHVVLMNDSAAADDYRRLRVKLRWDTSYLA